MSTEMQYTLTVGGIAAIAALWGAVVVLFRRLEGVRDAHYNCIADNIKLTERVHALEEDGLSEAYVLIDQSGHIREWSQGATFLFQWRQVQAIGKHVHMLIPDIYKAAHDAAWQEIVSNRRIPRMGPFRFRAATRSGDEIPIMMKLSSFEDAGTIYVAARIRLRSAVMEEFAQASKSG